VASRTRSQLPARDDIYKQPWDIAIADDAREVRQPYPAAGRPSSNWTKTANNAITNAAKQVAISTQAAIDREIADFDKLAPTYDFNY
jgi:hypothetical protein